MRLLLADENDDFLDGLSAWLEESSRFQVVGVAHSGQEAVERAGRLAPQLVLMDVRLPDIGGLEATRQIKSRPGAPLVILMTFHDSAAARSEARSAGADGCLSKTEITRELSVVVEAILGARKRGTGAAGPVADLNHGAGSRMRENEKRRTT